MPNYREIVTKTVIGKGKKTFSDKYILTPAEVPNTILGCWVINHSFKGYKLGDKIKIEGSCDINIWYSSENDTKTVVANETIKYEELLSITRKEEADLTDDEQIIVRSLRQPTCTNVKINNNKIEYEITKELGIEIVGDAKVRIAIDEAEDEWEELFDEQEIDETIDNNVKEEFIDQNII